MTESSKKTQLHCVHHSLPYMIETDLLAPVACGLSVYNARLQTLRRGSYSARDVTILCCCPMTGFSTCHFSSRGPSASIPTRQPGNGLYSPPRDTRPKPENQSRQPPRSPSRAGVGDIVGGDDERVAPCVRVYKEVLWGWVEGPYPQRVPFPSDIPLLLPYLARTIGIFASRPTQYYRDDEPLIHNFPHIDIV